VATSILFESNGGQQRGEATQAEVRLAVAEPGLTIGSVEQCLESLADSCYYLSADRNRYRFTFQPNLNKLLADRRASIGAPAIEEKVRAEIQKVFAAGSGIERVYFPRQSSQVPDRPVLALVVLPPENASAEPATTALINTITTESGSSSRTFKSALIWAVAEDSNALREEARKLLAWKDIEGDADELKLDDVQQRQLAEYAKRAERDLREAVWRTYKNLFLLAEDNSLRHIDLGLVHSSTATSMVELILSRLGQVDLVAPGATPSFLTRYWPPALPEWSTRSVRDAFYASPKFPRLLKPDAVKETISRGLDASLIAYVGHAADGSYAPFVYKRSLAAHEIEIADDLYLIRHERAEEYLAQKSTLPPVAPSKPADGGADAPETTVPPAGGQPSWEDDQEPQPSTAGFTWTGEVSSQKWMNFYTKVLSRFATTSGLKLTVTVEVDPPSGTTPSKVEETKAALRELGMPDDINVKR
jgi:hypothetical protein